MRILGMMSGTSLDGIDAAILETDGLEIMDFGPAATFPYLPSEKEAIQKAIDKALEWGGKGKRPPEFDVAEKAITEAHARVVEKMRTRPDAGHIDLIGFHGQTILHRPEMKLTVQLGNGAALAQKTATDVVGDFRRNDVALGGQGAPLVPIYHQALLRRQQQSLNDPVAVLNIGGVANLTYLDEGHELIALDTGPGNGLLDQWMVLRGLGAYDKDGALAQKGQVNEKYLRQLMHHPYFNAPIPKSLDRYDFNLSTIKELSDEDGAATLAAFSVAAIIKAIEFLPMAPKLWIICGGGRKNRTIMSMLGARTGVECIDADDFSWRGDDVEAEAFAYLAARHIKNLPITFPGTTGVEKPATGGILFKAE